MQIVNVGSYHCDFCKKDIMVRLHTDNPNNAIDYKEECVKWAKNFHWYDHHYNCALCGKWIPGGERELAIEKEFPYEINPKYNVTNRDGLLRVHKKCMEEGKN